MDFTARQLEDSSKRWNYNEAKMIVAECEQLMHDKSDTRTHDLFTKILIESYSKAIITTKEILTLLYHGYPEGAMALSRVLYESMVVMQFLYKHKDSDGLLERYIDDYAVKVSRDRIKYYNYLLEYSQSDEEREQAQSLKVEARKEHNKLKDKYRDYLSYNKQGNYLHDYWWVGDVIKSRSFSAIAHSGIVGNSVRFGTMFDETVLSTSGSLDGFEIPLCFSFVCFGILSETMFNTIGTECAYIIDKIEKIIAPFEDCLYR